MKRFIVLLLPLLLIGCSVNRSQNNGAEQVVLSEAVTFALSPPPEHLWGRQLSQLLSITYGTETKQVVVNTEFSASTIEMVAMTPMGIPVVELSYVAGEKLSAKRFISVKNLEPSYIIADLQLALWPVAILQTHLTGDDVRLTAEHETRKLLQGKTVVMTVHYHQSSIEIEHHLRGYSLTLTELN